MKVHLKSFQVCNFPGDIHESAVESFQVTHLWKLPRDIYKSAPEIFPLFLAVTKLWVVTYIQLYPI